jgi:predicted anti-sigma-YlaC factor YlaD
MRCEDVTPHLADYLAGTLAARTRDEIQQHLLACAACRDEFEGAADTWQMLEGVPAERPDSGAMRARFDAMIEGYEHGRARAMVTPVRERLLAWLRTPRRLSPALQACAALLVLLAGATLGRATAPAPSTPVPEIVTMQDELRDLRRMVTLSLMQQQSASERLRGVSWSSQLDEPGSEVVTALLDALRHDQNVNVRLASIDALKRFAGQEAVRRACVDTLSDQSSPLVQIALIDFVVEAGDRTAIGALRRLSQDSMLDDAVRMRAASGVQRLGAAS